MKRKPTALLHIDEKQRDMHTIYWISLWLRMFGFEVFFCNRATRDLMWEVIRPDVMLDSHLNYYDLETLEYRSRFTKLCILPVEGALFNDKIVTWLYFGKKTDKEKRVKYLAKTFLWGRRTVRLFLEMGFFRKDQIVFSGDPKYDIYVKETSSGKGKKLGILTMFSGINIFDNRNMLEHYDGLRGSQGIYYAENRNVEDFVWYHACGFRVMMDMVDHLTKAGNFELLLRPHQHENSKNYEYLKKKFPTNVNIKIGSPFFEYLENVYAVILCKSTTIIDAIIARKPVISVEKLMGDRLEDHMNMPDNRIPLLMQYTWQPKTFEEAIKLCQKAKEGILPLTPDPQGFEELTRDYFGYPRELPSTYVIAKEMAELYSQNRDFFVHKKKIFVPRISKTIRLSITVIKTLFFKRLKNNCFVIEDKKSLEKIWHEKIFSENLRKQIKKV